MGKYSETLLGLAGPALGSPNPPCPNVPPGSEALAAELTALLRQRNGFFAFESALHVFPSGPVKAGNNLEAWNAESLWRDAYDDMANGCFFFAEDVFGGQFCFRDHAVYTFDPETGGLELLSDSVEGWAQAVIRNYEVLLGFPLAREWQEKQGSIPVGSRLIPRTPFVLGGEFTVENLRAVDAAKSIRHRGEIAKQIRDLPDGAQIRLEVIA